MPSAETVFDVTWPLLSTLFGVVVGALIAFQVSKNAVENERHSRSQKVAGALMQSLEMNVRILASNARALETEVGILADGKELLAPPQRLQGGLMGLLLVEVPEQLASDDGLEQFREVAVGVDYYNECVESRAMYHATSGAMSNRSNSLRLRDEHILREGRALEPRITLAIDSLRTISARTRTTLPEAPETADN